MLQVRANYTNEVNSRTELEMLLRDCVEDVRREGERRYVGRMLAVHGLITSVTMTNHLISI